MRIKSVGECKFCRKVLSGSGMARHLQSCSERKKLVESEKKQAEIFLLKAGSNPFWIYFEIDALSTLEDIDNFLRDIWLECCGHLSAFEIGGTRYVSDPDPMFEDLDMDVRLVNVIEPGFIMFHEYDFGSTTRLELKCISKREGMHKKKIELIARNNLPDFRCDCGKPAKEIFWDRLLCESCAKEQESDEEMSLPVVNSPRMGVCGYEG